MKISQVKVSILIPRRCKLTFIQLMFKKWTIYNHLTTSPFIIHSFITDCLNVNKSSGTYIDDNDFFVCGIHEEAVTSLCKKGFMQI